MTDNQRDGEPEEIELYTIEVNGSPVVISAFEVGDTAGAIAAAANNILVEAYPMYCGKAFTTLVGAEVTVRQPTELEVEEWERSYAATGSFCANIAEAAFSTLSTESTQSEHRPSSFPAGGV